MKIIDNLYVVPGVVANPYIIVDPDGLTVIDAGIPRNAKAILAYIAGLGRSARDVKRIVITHADVDHVGGLAALQKASGARTYASRIEAEAIAQGKPSRVIRRRGLSLRRILMVVAGPFVKPAPFAIDEILAEGQALPVLGGLQVLETPGHTPGHISLYSPSTGVLFCGDSMVSADGRLLGSRPGITWDEARARESEARQAGLGARVVCPGHGPVVTEAAGKFPA